jgi:23S rRNA (cytosine1962-C5)-methyltransferase
MERMVDTIVDAVDALAAPTTLVLKNDSGARSAEGLSSYVEVRRGTAGATELIEQGVHFEISLQSGQKTGWFYDQRDNRARFPNLQREARVLDLFSYVGAWGIGAAVRGARAVVCVDSSVPALELASINAERNGVGARVQTVRGDAAAYLAEAGEAFDWVVLDPPGLVPRRKDLARAQEHYRHLNRLALSRVARGGVLVTCSCSALLDETTHLAIIRGAARRARRDLALIGRGSMPADHPIDPMLPESAYLKCWFFHVN